ncbi:MAG: type II toxin-antitoxin system HicB family antitoxin [Rhodospirillales bacterium]|nr:type II toxin-antitoxin system HicB family antitoxin [Rhodospirillales bacterium]
MASYIALIHKEAQSDFGVSFPDLPGCVTAGRTLDEARAFAVEALALHIEGLVADGETIPIASDLETIMADRANRKAVAVLVELRARVPKTVRVNITLPEDALAEIDRYAENAGTTRSGLIVRATREFIRAA